VRKFLLIDADSNEDNPLPSISKFFRDKIFFQDSLTLFYILLEVLFHLILTDSTPPLSSGRDTKNVSSGRDTKNVSSVTPVYHCIMSPDILTVAIPSGRCKPTESALINEGACAWGRDGTQSKSLTTAILSCNISLFSIV
jgi:hypothetical protein